MFESLRQPPRPLGQREAVALWNRSKQQWDVHPVLREGDELHSDDLVVSDSVLAEWRLRADPVASIAASTMASHGNAAMVELDNMLEDRGVDLRAWLATAEVNLAADVSPARL